MDTQLIGNLARERERVKAAERALENADKILQLTPEWAARNEVIQELQRARQFEKAQDDIVRAIALSEFGSTGVKSAHPAVTIKMFKRFVYDARQALDYAREHIPNALKLDARAFEKAAQALGLDFVTIEDDPRPQIASDLSEYAQ